MTWKLLFLTLVLGVSYVLYTPVPTDLPEPLKYRTVIAVTRIVDLVVSFQDLIWPYEPNDVLLSRFLMDRGSPEPVPITPGSKFNASYELFDGVPVRLYRPITKRDQLLPGFIFIHGGGFCIGSTRSYDGLTREFADALDAVVVSIEYRLSPEYPFPIPFEDSLKASKWFISHARDYNVDPSRIGIGGESAGGCLASGVTQHIHDSNITDPKVQVLIYPSLQKLDTKTPSYQKFTSLFGRHGLLPSKKSARFVSYRSFGKKDPDFEEKYLQNLHTSSEFKKSSGMSRLDHSIVPVGLRSQSFYQGKTDTSQGDPKLWEKIEGIFTDPRYNPLAREDLRGLPETYIQTCGYDPLRDDGIFYHEALKAAGVKSMWVDYEFGFHGIFWLDDFDFDLGKQMRKDAYDFIKKRL